MDRLSVGRRIYRNVQMKVKNEVWESLNWSKSNSILAEELDITQEAVRLQRKKRKKPEPTILKAGRAILDEFTNLGLSRQRIYQLRKQKEHKCIICGGPLVTKFHCEYHRQQANQRANLRNQQLAA
jgi:hypothetical protein